MDQTRGCSPEPAMCVVAGTNRVVESISPDITDQLLSLDHGRVSEVLGYLV